MSRGQQASEGRGRPKDTASGHLAEPRDCLFVNSERKEGWPDVPARVSGDLCLFKGPRLQEMDVAFSKGVGENRRFMHPASCTRHHLFRCLFLIMAGARETGRVEARRRPQRVGQPTQHQVFLLSRTCKALSVCDPHPAPLCCGDGRASRRRRRRRRACLLGGEAPCCLLFLLQGRTMVF